MTQSGVTLAVGGAHTADRWEWTETRVARRPEKALTWGHLVSEMGSPECQ